MDKLFIDEIVKIMETMEIDNPLSAIVIVSNGNKFGGFPYNLNKISNIDKVDIIDYLLRHLNINIDDVEECKKLSDENKYMTKEITKIRSFT